MATTNSTAFGTPPPARPCPLCGGSAANPAFPFETDWGGVRYRYQACASCGTSFVDHTPTAEVLRRMYTKTSYHDEHYENWDEAAHRLSIKRVRHALPDLRSIVDFGCGTGGFLCAARQNDLEGVGVELDPEVARQASMRSGATVVDLPGLRALGRRFGALRLGDVLEHLPDPLSTVQELAEFISPGGVFILEGPLQAHPSLVYWASSAIKRGRRMAGLDRPDKIPPLHLILTNARAQKEFFTERMGWTCLEFLVYEDGWPYLASKLGGSPAGRLVKKAVGTAAVIASRLDPRADGLGNRCFAVFRPSPSNGQG